MNRIVELVNSNILLVMKQQLMLGSEVSMKGDVYNYGVLLLEMMTRSKPIDSMFYEGLNLSNYVKKALPNHLMEVVEPKLVRNEKEDGAKMEFNNKQSIKQIKNGNQIDDCLISMLRIWLACSNGYKRCHP
ncbi:hypothetical protein LguiA_030737 [Lonicera macranthoides]